MGNTFDDPNFFEIKEANSRFIRSLQVVCFSTITILLVIVLTSYSNIKFGFKDNTSRVAFLLFCCSIIIGFASNILTSVYYSIWLRRYFSQQQNKKLEIISNLSNKSLLLDVFSDLEYYDKRYCSDYSIDVVLHKRLVEGICTCKVKYKYKKVLRKKDLIFQFIRIQNEEQFEILNSESEEVNINYLQKEYYWQFDERSFQVRNLDSLYNLSYLEISVNGRKSYRPKIEKVIQENIIEYRTTIQEDFDLKNNTVGIEYEVEFPIEDESHLFFTVELPTENIKCTFDYSERYNEIDLYAYDFLSSHRGPTPLHSLEETKLRFSKLGWVLPKSSFFFIWNRK